MAEMTATEARIRATIEREEDVERDMEDIMNKIEAACDQGKVTLIVNKTDISLRVVQKLTNLGYVVISNKDICDPHCIIKW